MVDIVEALADCLETMRQKGDVAACLARYPAHRRQLEALLQVAALIRPLPDDVAPSFTFRETAISLILAGEVPTQWYPASDPLERPSN